VAVADMLGVGQRAGHLRDDLHRLACVVGLSTWRSCPPQHAQPRSGCACGCASVPIVAPTCSDYSRGGSASACSGGLSVSLSLRWCQGRWRWRATPSTGRHCHKGGAPCMPVGVLNGGGASQRAGTQTRRGVDCEVSESHDRSGSGKARSYCVSWVDGTCADRGTGKGLHGVWDVAS
jgi:hypothetical protein